jgi:hypothetical protein
MGKRELSNVQHDWNKRVNHIIMIPNTSDKKIIKEVLKPMLGAN